MDFPQNSRRASTQASATPNGVATSVATTATRSESWIAVHSVGEISSTSGRRLDQIDEAVALENGLGGLRQQEGQISSGLGFCLRRRGYGIDDRRMRIGRKDADDLHAGLYLGVGRIDDPEG